MFTLVIGGAGSGKSAYAENLLLDAPGQPRLYLATMEVRDRESLARVERHRKARAEKGFATIERYTDLAGLDLPTGSAVLLECMSNLCANERYSPQGSGDGALDAVLAGVEHLLTRCQTLVVVSNEVFSGGSRYADDTLAYLRLLAAVNRTLAVRADAVVEVVCGMAIPHKGVRP